MLTAHECGLVVTLGVVVQFEKLDEMEANVPSLQAPNELGIPNVLSLLPFIIHDYDLVLIIERNLRNTNLPYVGFMSFVEVRII